MNENSTIPPDAPRPRLCHIKKWADFNGYGFNLHAERGKAGQFVGTIDLGSPAEVAQLRAGDRIIEVNGTNIGSENHQQVVQRIKSVPNETTLLVVDNDTDAYYRDRKILVHSGMSNIEYHETPVINPFTHQVTGLAESVENVKVSDADYERYQARLCRLRIWPDFVGYGFNLHADRSKTGQFIGKVDVQSPAQESGLREGDRIMEVNGVSVIEKSHPEVVTLVKSRQGEVEMLVVDNEADDHFRSHGVSVNGSMPGVVTITCPVSNPYTANGDVEHTSEAEAVHQQSGTHSGGPVHEESHAYIAESLTPEPSHSEVEHVVKGLEDATNHVHVSDSSHENQAVPEFDSHISEEVLVSSHTEPKQEVHSTLSTPSQNSDVSSTSQTAPTPVPSPSPTPSAATSGKSVTVGGIEFAGSAKEARERMNKKRNVKTDPNLTLKDKYDILQKL